MTTGDTLRFYEHLAERYHLIYADWHDAIEQYGAPLDRLLRDLWGDPPADVLDCSCGIGTQALGLAARGYAVHATDISVAAVARAAREAAAKGVTLTTGVADMRQLAAQVPGDFDVVLSCDNSVPHLLTDEDLQQAADGFRAKLRVGGLLLISMRDYDRIRAERPISQPPRVFDDRGGRRIVFQVWDWSEDGAQYAVELFIMQRQADGWHTDSFTATYRALQRQELSAVLAQAGFVDVRWHMPEDTGYYQPIVTARRA